MEVQIGFVFWYHFLVYVYTMASTYLNALAREHLGGMAGVHYPETSVYIRHLGKVATAKRFGIWTK